MVCNITFVLYVKQNIETEENSILEPTFKGITHSWLLTTLLWKNLRCSEPGDHLILVD